MKKLELIQIRELDANFIIIYENGTIDYVNYFMGIDHNAIDEITHFIDEKDQRFTKIFLAFYRNINVSMDIALEQAWDLHCSLFLDLDEKY